ncbi:MAG: adenosylcobinamide-GDP ribazoletransferase [Maricaulaceae bacterium]
MRSELSVFLLAVQFLTRLPVPVGDAYTPERFAASVRYYPAVGALVGGLCALVYAIAILVFPQSLSVMCAVSAGVVITGGFHEDGLADTADGVGGGQSRDQALEIMKDSRIGTYGVLALGLVTAAMVSGLATLSPGEIPVALVMTHGLSRLSSVWVIATSRYVRAEGTGKPVSQGVSRLGLAVATATGLALCIGGAAVLPFPALGCAGLGLALGHGLSRLSFERKLGGYTGDTLGATQQLSALGVYWGLAAWA